MAGAVGLLRGGWALATPAARRLPLPVAAAAAAGLRRRRAPRPGPGPRPRALRAGAKAPKAPGAPAAPAGGEEEPLALGSLGPGVEAGEGEWARTALEAAEAAAGSMQAVHGVELALYGFRCAAGKVEISLDRLDNPYGSPSLDDIGRFTQIFHRRLELTVGEERAGEVEVEVSSPGAEREVRVPEDLERFAGLPLDVRYRDEDEAGPFERTEALRLVALDAAAGTAEWELADVRANNRRRHSKKKKKERRGERGGGRKAGVAFELALERVVRVNIHLDI